MMRQAITSGMDSVVQAAKGLGRRLRFTGAVVIILSLTFSLAGTLFSLRQAIVSRPVLAQHPEQLVALSMVDGNGRPQLLGEDDWRSIAPDGVFRSTTMYRGGGMLNCRIGDLVVAASIESTGPEYFELLGTPPILGTGFNHSKDSLVLGHRFWQKHFGGLPSAIGEVLLVEQLPMTVVGVMPQLSGLQADAAPDLFIPIAALGRLLRAPPSQPTRAERLIGRLRTGTSAQTATIAINTAWSGAQQHLASPRLAEAQPKLEPIPAGFSHLRTLYAEPLGLLLALAVVLLGVATVNVLGLFTVHYNARRHELDLRQALGASHPRLITMLLAENLLAVLIAFAIALPVVWASNQLLLSMVWTGSSSPTINAWPSPAVWLTSLLVCIAVALAITALPLSLAARRARKGSRTITSSVEQSADVFLIVQFALAAGLVVIAAMFGRSLISLRQIDLGLEANGIVFSRLVAQPGGYSDFESRSYYEQLLLGIGSIPGVEAASLSRTFPARFIDGVQVTLAHANTPVNAGRQIVSPRFFQTVGVELMKGREFAETDRADTPLVAIVSLALARALASEGNHPLDQSIRIGDDTDARIIGIVSDARFSDVRSPDAKAVFLSSTQIATFRAPILLVRTSAPATTVMPLLDDSVRRLGREYPVRLLSMAQYLDFQFLRERLLATFGAVFASASLVLVAAAVLALTRFTVRHRRRELGIRIALGAHAGRIRLRLVRRAALLGALGLATGIPAASVVMRVIESTAPGWNGLSAEAIFGAVVLLLTLSMGGAWFASREVASTDLHCVLQSE